MKDTSHELLKELIRLDIKREDIETAKEVMSACPDAVDTLENPLITLDEKRNIIKKIFPQSLERFITSAAKSGNVA